MDSIKSNNMTLNNKMSIQQIQEEAEKYLFCQFVSFESLHFER